MSTGISLLIGLYGLFTFGMAIWAGIALARKPDLSKLVVPGFAGSYLRFTIRILVFAVTFIAVSEAMSLPVRLPSAVTSR